MRMAAAVGLTACVGFMAGCGNSYRPVVATIGVVGPAGQPTKYAIAVSSASPTANGLITMVDFSGDTVLVNATLGVNPYYFVLSPQGTTGYTLNSDKTLNSFDISTSLISSEILESTLLPGANPVSLLPLSSSTYISDTGISAFDQLTGTPPALKQELPVPSGYAPLYVVGQSGAQRAYAITPSTTGGPGQVQAIENANNSSSSPTISATLTVGRGPVYGVMTVDDRRAFILNQTDGTVTAINTLTNALDTPLNTITVGTRPVWADLASGLDELVVANEGTGTSNGSVTIISIPLCSATALPTNPNCDPTNPIDATTFGQVVATVPVGVNPIMVTVLSDYTRAYVANTGNLSMACSPTGIATQSTFWSPGASLWNATTAYAVNQEVTYQGSLYVSLQNGNLNQTPAKSAFWSPVANPPGAWSATTTYTTNQMVIYQGSLYVSLQNGNLNQTPPTTACTVSVVNLLTDTVTATIPIAGHPAWIASSAGTPTGKVYVVCNDSQVMTVIETDTDSVDTTIPLQGFGVSVRVTAP
jgi:hypothetical protein